jgi:MFS family permease
MRTYLELFRTKGVAAVIWSQLLARFAFGMSTITFAVHLQQIFGNYTVAGLAIGATTLGQALSGPILGRLMAKWGIRPVVVIGSLLAPVCFLLIGFAPISEGFAIAVSLILGFATPPIQPAARAVYPTLVKTESQRSTLFSVDAILQEVIWILGPVLATVLIATTNTIVPIIAMAAIQLFGGLWFALLPQVHDAPIPRSTKRMGSVLRSRMVRVMIVVNLLFVASFSALEIGTIAAVGQAEAGFVLCMLSIGSVVGGLAWGHRARSPMALTKQLGIVLLGDLLIFFNANNAIWLGVCLFISGIGVAIAFATIGMIISKTVKLDETTEVYGWINSGQSIGYGAGAAVAGIVVDKLTSTTSFALASGLDFLALLVALSAVAITPAFLNSESKKEDTK